jgi:response regulator NasT
VSTNGNKEERALRVLVANEHKQGLERIAEAVAELGHDVVSRQKDPGEVAAAVLSQEPDVALVGLHQDREHALELIGEIADESTCPVIALVDEEDPEFVAKAADRGVFATASVQDHQALTSALAVALTRFSDYERLATAFDRRALTERAKGILMERHRLDERPAFQLLRNHARSHNARLYDVAEAVTRAHRLLPWQK